MITVRKLYTLKKSTRMRKFVRLLEDWERELPAGGGPDLLYLRDLLGRMAADTDLDEQVRHRAGDARSRWESGDSVLRRRLCNGLRHELLNQMGIPPAEWDLVHPGDALPDRERQCFPGVRIFLDDIRSPFNVGSVFRTAECLGVSELLLSPGTADPSHPRALRTSMGCIERIPWRRMTHEELSLAGSPMFALELGGEPISQFSFPPEGILILGSEEVGVSPECLALSDHSLGRVTIPQYGLKGSLNVSVAFGIVMNQWSSALSMAG